MKLAYPRLGTKRTAATRRTVIIADRIADWTIRIGGIGVILAVLGIMIFLVEVIVPLFTGGNVVDERSLTRAAHATRSTALTEIMDEYATLSVIIHRDGSVTVTHLDTGTEIEAPGFEFPSGDATAVARTLSGRDLAFGFDDGSLVFGTLNLPVKIYSTETLPDGLSRLAGGDFTDGSSIFSPAAAGQFRRVSVDLQQTDPEQIAAPGVAIVAADYRVGGTTERPTRSFVTVGADGIVRLSRAETRRNLLTGATQTDVTTSTLPTLPAGTHALAVLMNDQADTVLVASSEGVIYRFDTRNFERPVLAETVDLLPDGIHLTAIDYLIGDTALVVGASNGSMRVYFLLQREAARSTDGYALALAYELEPHSGAVLAISPSQRGRMFATADARGEVWVRHSTSRQTLLKPGRPTGRPYQTLTLAPREDGVLAVRADGRMHYWQIHVPHPETTLRTIFGKIWYEGYQEPSYTWQSSSGTDRFEPKFSLVPLIFGTFKATLYSLLFAIPIALAAAIYTSEFVHYRVRMVVKPIMEMMASLPSVVLGFIAALVLAPIVETWIAAVLLAFVALPLGFIFAAYLWQLLPGEVQRRMDGTPKLGLMLLVLLAAMYCAYAFGPLFERVFFLGDFKAWVDGRIGTGTPFLFLLLWPISFAVAYLTLNRLASQRYRVWLRHRSDFAAALVDAARWLGLLLGSAVVSYLAALLLSSAGVDPRGGIVDTYVQRNTLVVGFAMGFAVIPIIYTIAEDALNAVPEHLRAASLACGATRWQTATSVVLPTAVSGVFAACMIGMGRAVGETMIVVMAAGNTPILDWNIFNGLRALSANIAVELPEAVKDGTLYRMLFLAALTLFMMTFVVNTMAEFVRLRFRKRATSL
jgi:phosphate transport system permease protein